MAKSNPLLPSFNGGEFSPRMHARTDFQKYPQGAEILENAIPLPQGGWTRRPGTRFAAPVANENAKHRLASFAAGTEQAYILEFGPGTIRMFRNQGQIIVPGSTLAVISNGEFTSNTTGWDDRSDGSASIAHDSTNGRLNLVGTGGGDAAWAEQDVVIGSTAVGLEHALRFRVVGVPGDLIQFRVGNDSKGAGVVSDLVLGPGYHLVSFTPQAATTYIQFRNLFSKTIAIDDVAFIGAGQAIQLGNPYTESQLFELQATQNANTAYLFHALHRPHKLTRRSHTSWSLTEVDWDDGPWLTENADASKTLTPSATSGLGITITAVGHAPFAATDIGRLVRISNPASGTAYGSARITGFTSATVVTADVQNAFSTANASSSWRLGAWSATTGYPVTGTFADQRLGSANTLTQPQTFWLSQSADIENMRPDDGAGTVADDDALAFTIAADQVNAIRWMQNTRDLVLGTSGGEWSVTSSGAAITPTDIAAKRRTAHGSAEVVPVTIGDVVLFLQRAGRKIRELGFHFEVDGYKAFDLTRLADHVLRGGVSQLAFQQEKDGLLWCVRNDGQLAALTYLRDEDVIGWSRHVIGGSFGAGNAVVESVAVIPGNAIAGSEDRDEVWLIVKRVINGQIRRYVEFLEDIYEEGDDQADAFYVDCGLTYEGSPVKQIGGLDHLEGETVKIWADGAVQAEKTVQDGEITLDIIAAKAQIGLGFGTRGSVYKSLKLEAGTAAGTAVGKTGRIRGVTMVVLYAHTVEAGPSLDDLQKIDFREIDDPMDTPVPLFSGEHFLGFEGDYESDPRMVIRVTDPVPFTLLALAPEIRKSDRP